MLYKKILFILLTISFISCEVEEKPTQEIKKTYEFQKILWQVNENAEISYDTVYSAEKVRENSADTSIVLSLDALENFNASSVFSFSENQYDLNKISEIPLVEIPSSFENLNYDYSEFSGLVKAPLTQDIYEFPFSSNIIDSVTLEPGQKIEYQSQIILAIVPLNFKAVFIEQPTGKEIELYGSWVGTFLASQVSSIKNLD